MATSSTIVIEFYDGWQARGKASWRKNALLVCRANGNSKHLIPALGRKLEHVKILMTDEELLKYWYSHQVSALLVALSQEKDSGFKSVPRLQPCLTVPQDTSTIVCVFLGPEQGTYAVEAYLLKPAAGSLGLIKQRVPLAQQSPTPSVQEER